MTIYEAIISEDLEAVIDILAHDPTCIDNEDDKGRCMSFVAAETGNLGIVRYIVEYSRASMNVVDQSLRNILHYATLSGSVEVAQYLVEKVGMSPVVGDTNRITPYEMSRSLGHKDLEAYYETVVKCPLDNMYKNPIRTGMYPDPSILRVGDDYYMVNSSFIFFPCIPISHSKDLVNWTIIGHAITNPDWAYLDELEGGRGYWAPDISYYEGRFYIAATYRLNDTGTIYRKQMVVSSDKPEGPYCEPAFIDEDGIDPSIFNDEDGRRYMLLNRGARIFEISQDGTKQISEATMLYYGDQKRAPEGPHLLKKDGYYYLFLAEGGTGPGHRITVSRSRTLMGNYEPCPYNPIMRQHDPMAPIQRCGHGKPVMTPEGDWYMVYLCGRLLGDGYTVLGRETALDPIRWTADGWPIVNELKGPSVLQKKPLMIPADKGQETNPLVTKVDYHFEDEVLSRDWMFPRPPEKDGYRIENNQLVIKGSQHPLSMRESRNIVLRRQENFDFEGMATMEVVTLDKGQEAGLTCYYDENTWLTFGLVGTQEGNNLVLKEHIGHEDFIHQETVVLSQETKQITLKVVVEGLVRSFYYSVDGQHFDLLKTLKNVYYLSDEGIKMGKRFTGAMVGMFAVSEQKPLYIAFDSFVYESLDKTKERIHE